MLECGLNKCMCVKDTTIEGIEIGKIYQYIHTPEYETNKERKTYSIIIFRISSLSTMTYILIRRMTIVSKFRKKRSTISWHIIRIAFS